MSNFFKIDPDKKNESTKVELKVYTYSGKQEYEDDEGFPLLYFDLSENDVSDVFNMIGAYALKIKTGNTERLYVKRGKHGQLFNPVGLYSEGTEHRQLRHAGKPEWAFAKTNKKVFDLYTQFLKTKNPAWLNNAEREV